MLTNYLSFPDALCRSLGSDGKLIDSRYSQNVADTNAPPQAKTAVKTAIIK